MKKIVLLIIIAVVEFFAIKSWFACTRFADFFHFSLLDLSLRIDEASHNDVGIHIAVVRTFHNKALGAFVDSYKIFLHYWDILFLANFVSIVAVIGTLLAVWYLFQKNSQKRYVIALFLFLIIAQVTEIFLKPNINFVIKAFCLFIPLLIISLIGWNEFIKQNKKRCIWVILVLCFVSIWWLLTFNQAISTYCFV